MIELECVGGPKDGETRTRPSNEREFRVAAKPEDFYARAIIGAPEHYNPVTAPALLEGVYRRGVFLGCHVWIWQGYQ